MNSDNRKQLFREMEILHDKYVMSQNRESDFFEPVMLEYLDKFEGYYNEQNGIMTLRFDSRGTRYNGRTEHIEYVNSGEKVRAVREKDNPFNSNNFMLLTENGINIGNMPAELCNVIAPLYDNGELEIMYTEVSFVDPISKRSRYAKQAILFVEMKIRV